MKMVWPGPSGVGHVRLAFQPASPGENVTVEKDGVWAWFRLLQDAHLKPLGGGDRYLATFTVGNRNASFEIRANSIVNPFASNQVESFRCPPKL
jgi:type VI secretion system protein ImpL